MSDMIDRDKLLDLLNKRREFLQKVYDLNKDGDSAVVILHAEALETTEEIYDMIAEMPYECTAQTGKWEQSPYGRNEYWCSCCKDKGGTFGNFKPPPFKFCPHCGAKMV